MADPNPETPRTRTATWIKILLVASLGVNLLVVGLVAGSLVNDRKSGGPTAQRFDGPNPFLRAMTRDDARKMQGLLRRQSGELGQSREVGRAAMQSILQQLRSDTFSEAELRSSFAQMQSANSARAELGTEAIIAHLTTLDGAGRAEFADRLEEALSRRGPSRRGGPGQPRN